MVDDSNHGFLRSIRESILRELRRDLAKLARPLVYSKKKEKSVNLRPGLALGVITLQAGSRPTNQPPCTEG